MHAAVKARFKPSAQARLGAGEVNAGHADLGESHFVSPAPNTLHERQAPITRCNVCSGSAATLNSAAAAPKRSTATGSLQGNAAQGVGIHAPILGSRLPSPAEPLMQRTWAWADEAACAAQAAALVRSPALREAFIELHGPLGAGKTTFVRHLLRALGVAGRIKSPTYTVLESYVARFDEQPITISHCDFYRFADPREWADAGLRDLFSEPGLKLVEWADNASGMLPLADLRLFIEPQEGETRRVLAQAYTPRGVELLS
jgi:tRNA threonylcarbamoyladenosine biosynthesis protein TsaE